MNKNVIVFNESAFNAQMAGIGEAQHAFQNLLNEANRLNVIKVDSMQELISLAQQKENFIKEKIAEQLNPQVVVLGFKMKRKAIIENLDLPDFGLLNSLCSACERHIGAAKHLILKGNQIIIEEKEIEKIKLFNSLLARTPEQQNLLDAHRKLAEVMNAFNDAHAKVYGSGISDDTKLRSLFRIEAEKFEELKINEGDFTRVEVGKKLSNHQVQINGYFYSTNPFPYKNQ